MPQKIKKSVEVTVGALEKPRPRPVLAFVVLILGLALLSLPLVLLTCEYAEEANTTENAK